MREARGGFTLIELMVVVIILGILTSLGVPYYLKTVEHSRATDAVAMANMVAAASRMLVVDNPTVAYNGGALTNSCNSGACPTGAAARDGCSLVRCNYVSRQDWDNLAYSMTACNPVTGAGGGGCAAGVAAAAQRRSGPYAAWSYYFTDTGRCVAGGGAPSCPSF